MSTVVRPASFLAILISVLAALPSRSASDTDVSIVKATEVVIKDNLIISIQGPGFVLGGAKAEPAKG